MKQITEGLLLLAAITTLLNPAQGLQCYTCGYTVGEDFTCVTSPESVTGSPPITDCVQGKDVCCTITKQVYREDKDDMISFSRGCQPNCPDMNDWKETEDWSHIFYQTFCDSPLCNIGDGDNPIKPGGGGDGDDGIINNIPGESNTGHRMAAAAGQGALLINIMLAMIYIIYRG